MLPQRTSTLRRLTMPALLAGFACLVCCLASFPTALAQSSSTGSQSFVFAGLRSVVARGSVQALAADASGNLFLLFDQGDGVRILKVSNGGSQLLGQIHLGATGDVGTALTLDPAGNIYITGTSSSAALAATSGAAFAAAAPGITSSFVARFDNSLNELFLTFTGGTRIAASAIAASQDAVFITGITYASDLPSTPNAIQQTPASGSLQNGFLERFSADGKTLVYATYITGSGGDTTPTGIAVDAPDDAWVVGSTTSSAFVTVAAIVPEILSTPSGFLMRISAAGDTLVFSTFVPGAGLSSIALDSTGQMLLLSGSVALGQFPVDSASTVLVPATYQVLLRMPLDGSSVASGSVIAPGLQSVLTPGANGEAWVGGDFAPGTAPLLPLSPLSSIGNGYAARVVPSVGVDQSIRFGGIANQQQTYASLPVLINGLAVDPADNLFAAGAAQPTASASLLGTETYDLPLRGSPTAAFPSGLRDAVLSPSLCQGSLCAGSAGYLAKVAPGSADPAITFSIDDLPFITLRNLGSGAATNLQLSTSAGSLLTSCPATLPPGGECAVLLSGGAPGTLTASASETASTTIAYGTYPASPPASSLVFSPKELDFGVQASASPPSSKTLTVTNLGSAPETFSSGVPASSGTESPFTEQSSDCTLTPTGSAKILAAGAACHVTIAFTAFADPASDGFVQAEWTLGSRLVFLTGYSQAASLSVSAAEIDFGTQFAGGLRLPRFLYLSNASASAAAHTSLSLLASSPFSLADECPAQLAPQSVCRIRIDYLSPTSPSADSATLALDQGLQVLLTGATKPAPGGSGTNPSLTVSPHAATFGDAVVVTQVSAFAQTIGVTNSGASPLSLSITLSGDFLFTSACPASLAAGSSCTVSVQFAPSQPGTRRGFLTIAAGTGTTPVQVALSGEGTAILAANNGILTFPGVPLSQPSVQFYKITQPLPNLTVAATGPFTVALLEDNGFGHGSPPASAFQPAAAAACPDCWLAIRFLPTVTGEQTGTLTFTSSPQGLPYVLALSGSGLATSGIITSPSVQDFGGIPVHSASGTLLLTVTNAFNPPQTVTLSPPAVTGPFTLAPPPNGGTACTGDLPYLASCFAGVVFTPGAPGPATGTITFRASNLSASPSIQLLGIGTPDSGVALAPLTLAFASSSAPQTVTVTNTGLSPVQIAAPTVTNSAFTLSSACRTLIPGAACSIQVGYVPGTAPAADTLTIPVTSGPSGTSPQTVDYTVALSGTLTQASLGLSILPGSLLFGPAATLTPGSIRQFSIANTSASNLALALSIPRNFVLSGPPCTALAPASTCTFQLQFVPLVNSDIAGTLSLLATPSDGSPPLSSLAYAEGYGLGTGSLSLSGGLIVHGVFNFGSVAVGRSSTQVFTLANPGPAAINVRRITSPPPFLSTTTCTQPLQPGATCTVSVTYTPTGQPSAAAGAPDVSSLSIESDAQSSPDILDLEGQFTGAPASGSAPVLATVTLSQGSLTFPPVSVGDISPAQLVTLTNTGTVPLQVASASSTTDFTVLNQCSAVAPGASCILSVASSPQTPGTHLAALEISSNVATSLEFVSLISIAQPPPLTVLPFALDFGAVQVGSTSTLTVQVTNNSTVSAPLTQVAVTGGYSAAGTCPPASGALDPQQSCTVAVTFAPTAAGPLPGTLTLTSGSSPLTVPLTGTGVAPANASFTLTVNGGSSATATVIVGEPATFALLVTPNGAFSGTISLTCTPVGAVPYASCSLLPTLVTISGAAATASITISTLQTGSISRPRGLGSRLGSRPDAPTALAVLLPTLLLILGRRRLRPRLATPLAICALLGLACLSGCGSGRTSTVHNTHPGTYQFTVTATSTTGPQITRSVTLNLIITPI